METINKLKEGYITITKIKIIAEGKEVAEDGTVIDISITEEVASEDMRERLKDMLDPTCPIDAMIAVTRQQNFDDELLENVKGILTLKEQCIN